MLNTKENLYIAVEAHSEEENHQEQAFLIYTADRQTFNSIVFEEDFEAIQKKRDDLNTFVEQNIIKPLEELKKELDACDDPVKREQIELSIKNKEILLDNLIQEFKQSTQNFSNKVEELSAQLYKEAQEEFCSFQIQSGETRPIYIFEDIVIFGSHLDESADITKELAKIAKAKKVELNSQDSTQDNSDDFTV